MARLVYSVIASLDGYVNDAEGGFAWAAPNEDVHAFVNDLERPVGTHVYGRRLYEVMRFWQDPSLAEDESPAMRDYAQIWQATDKVVVSATLEDVSTPRTRLVPAFDPDEIRRLTEASERDVTIGGPTLAAHAIAAGLVDEWHVVVVPVVVGGGTPWLPPGARVDLELAGVDRLPGGFVHLHHVTKR